jgi:predicted CoA-binding protein
VVLLLQERILSWIMILRTPAERKALLEHSKTVAVVGASPKADRPSHDIFIYLRDHGYTVVPITPMADMVAGVRTYATVAQYAAEHGAPDLVDVFRKPEDCIEVVHDAIAAGVKAIWFQLGVVNGEAIDLADRAGLDVVVDFCTKVEHRALVSN